LFHRVAALRVKPQGLTGTKSLSAWRNDSGNSGGPVVEDGRLVGIVSAQAIVEGTRVPFARAIKSHYVNPLMSEQQEKDKRWVGE
jgi:CBS domain-containing protein